LDDVPVGVAVPLWAGLDVELAFLAAAAVAVFCFFANSSMSWSPEVKKKISKLGTVYIQRRGKNAA
jgi:hypothetical protein